MNNIEKNKQQSPASPCVDICALDEQNVCMGCHRHGREISQWGTYTNEQKRQVLLFSNARSQGKIVAPLT